jgi:hypothetical protein
MSIGYYWLRVEPKAIFLWSQQHIFGFYEGLEICVGDLDM